MKKQICLCIAVLAVLSVTVFSVGCRRGSSLSNIISTNFSGTVEVKPSDDASWRALEKSGQVRVGSTIKTGADGSGSIGFKDEALLRLAPNTEVKIKSFSLKDDQKEIDIMLNEGDTFSSVDSGSWKYAVESPVAVMGVIGTDFRVTVNAYSGDTRVAVYTGIVSVEKDGVTINLAEKQALDIKGSEPLSEPEKIMLFKEVFNSGPVLNFIQKLQTERKRNIDTREIKTGQ